MTDKIRSEITRIENEVGTQADLISRIQAALVGKAAGGGGATGPRLPGEYQEVEYIQSTGTQWLDTGMTINTNTDTVELFFQYIDTTVYKWFFGEHDNNARFGLGSGDGTNKRNVAYGNNTYKVSDEQLYNEKHTFSATADGVFLDDAKICGFSSFASTSTLYLFNLNLSGGSYISKAKIWSYIHKRDGKTVRNLVPCYRKSDTTPGMYDLVTDEFYTNAGTGIFTYGPEVEYSSGGEGENLDAVLSIQDSLISQIQAALIGKAVKRSR